MKLFKKAEATLLVAILGCSNIMMAEELPEVNEVIEVNESILETTQNEELDEAIVYESQEAINSIENSQEVSEEPIEEVIDEEVVEEVLETHDDLAAGKLNLNINIAYKADGGKIDQATIFAKDSSGRYQRVTSVRGECKGKIIDIPTWSTGGDYFIQIKARDNQNCYLFDRTTQDGNIIIRDEDMDFYDINVNTEAEIHSISKYSNSNHMVSYLNEIYDLSGKNIHLFIDKDTKSSTIVRTTLKSNSVFYTVESFVSSWDWKKEINIGKTFMINQDCSKTYFNGQLQLNSALKDEDNNQLVHIYTFDNQSIDKGVKVMMSDSNTGYSCTQYGKLNGVFRIDMPPFKGTYQLKVKLDEGAPFEIVDEYSLDVYDGADLNLIQAFVRGLYTKCLEREAEKGGVNYWATELAKKTQNAASVLEKFICSDEYKKKNATDNQYVKMLYAVCMNRTASEKEVNYWVGQLQNGTSRRNVLADFVGCKEFTGICSQYGIEKGSIVKDNGGKNEESKDQVVNFVKRFYEKCLGRTGDQGGINHWANGLKAGTFTGQDIARNFILSDEFKKKNLDNSGFIKVLYSVLMDRNADQGGLNYWVQLLESGTSKESAINGFIDSPEFTKICNTYGIKKKKEDTQDKTPSSEEFEFVNGTILSYKGVNKSIVIPSEIGGKLVKEIGEGAFDRRSDLVSISLPEGIEKIGKNAFMGCTQLTEFTIPSTVKEVGVAALQGCDSLSEVKIYSNNLKVGNYAFSNCGSLTRVTLPEGVSEIGIGAFKDCTQLASIIIPGSVNKIEEYTFEGCSGLRDVTLSEGVTQIGEDVFQNCSSLVNIQMPNSLQDMSLGVFRNCSSLEKIKLPQNVRDIGYKTFAGCSRLVKVELPAQLIEIDQKAFENCSKLTSITIPKNIENVASDAFEGCSGLTSISYRDKEYSSIGSFMKAFDDFIKSHM